MPAPQADMRESAKKRKKRAWAKAQKRLEQNAEDAANKTAKRQSLPFDDVVGPADDMDTDMELVGPAAVEPVVGPAAVVDPASLDTLDDEDTLPYVGDASDEDQVDEQLTQRCSPERSARSPSPEAVRSPSQPPGTQVPDAGQLRPLPEIVDELAACEKNAAVLHVILSEGLVAEQQRVTAEQQRAVSGDERRAQEGECHKCWPGSCKRRFPGHLS